MGSPRTKVSMTIIAAPRCGQTKVGATMVTGAASTMLAHTGGRERTEEEYVPPRRITKY
jgi:hypothetical protein